MFSTDYKDLVILSGANNDPFFYAFTSQEYKDLSIVPTIPHRLIGPYKVGHRARLAGYSCQVVDFFNYIPEEQLQQILDRFVGPNTILGISVTHLFFSDNITNDPVVQKLLRTAMYVRKKHGNKILVGGYNSPKWKNFFNAEFVLEGKTENSVINFLNSNFNHGINKAVVPSWDITSCDFKWHIDDRIVPQETLPLETCRGCIYKCRFCRFEGIGKKRGTYVRDMSLIKDELVEAYEKFNVTNYQLLDDTFNDDIEKIKDWHKMASNLPFKLKYAAHIRGDLVEKFSDSAHLLAESGLYGCHIGVETLHPVAAKAIGKVWSAKRARDYLPSLKENSWSDVNISVNAMVGLPGEDFRSVHSMFRWIVEHKFSTVFYPLHLINAKETESETFSEFDLEAEKYGYKFDKDLEWVSPITNSLEARKIAKILNSKSAHLTPADSWDSNLFEGLGIQQKTVLEMSKKELFDSADLRIGITKFINKYINSFQS
jgi:radical SAM superfamily enzyme YgiQ (UPF0313 family)